MSDKRFTIKPQDCYWGITDNFNPDKITLINGLHTKIEAKWVCDFLNEQQATISQLKEKNEQLQKENTFLVKQRNYWKHKVNSLLWILGQFDEQKVKKLLEDLGE